jgi:hypothetical protein
MIQRLVWLGVLFLIAGLWMTGCTNTQRLTVSPLEPPPGYEKMSLHATLVLPEALCTYTFRIGGGRRVSHVSRSHCVRTGASYLGDPTALRSRV